MKIERKVVASGYDRLTCWVHARCGVRPANGRDKSLIITLQKSYMGSENHVHDIFSGLAMMRSDDAGRTWSPPIDQPELSRWPESDGIEVAPCDFTPQWHAKTSSLLGIGCTCEYLNGRQISPPRRRDTVYSVFDEEKGSWGRAFLLQMPHPERYSFCGAGCVQWVELPDGDILLPVYFADPQRLCDGLNFSVVVLRCSFDGETLVVREIGGQLSLPALRGFAEPSLIYCAGKYWLTIRNDVKAYVSRSDDGLNFETPRPWTFCDGAELGSFNTQQHWARLQDRLFLVYTRRGLDNDYVVRNRAPLLIGEVDLKQCVVLRDTEQVLVPNRGAQLGNFGAVQANDSEAWVCVSEWMENAGPWNREVWSALERRHPGADLSALAKMPGRCGICELDGSDNSIHLVKISLSE